ncbi:MAG: phosphatase PAP2 family protein [Daejeonella sp.]|uniref:phosphatase PAP2 family protein n=1 Tax=Daejeonella sp. JGW-45 TaxID=3034148 RepID=UPI0023EC19FA|nr:phosphatase PAP2 family protein [Daejeonella sp. JGW-45]
MRKSFRDILREHITFIIPFLILVIICFVILLTNAKAELFLRTNVYHNAFFDEFFKICTLLGDVVTTLVICIAMLFIRYRFAVLTFLAYAYSSVIVQILKRIFDSPRPSKFFEGLNPIRTIEGYPLYEWNSFPSGHSTNAFTLAVVLSFILSHRSRHWIIIPIAVLTAFSRVYLAQHFFQDVFAGAVLGVVLTFQLIWCLENTEWYHSPTLDGSLLKRR